MWYAWLLLKAATVPVMMKEDYLMSCLSQYLGDTPGIQVFLHSVTSTCALLCFNNLQKCCLCQHPVLQPHVWRESKAESSA